MITAYVEFTRVFLFQREGRFGLTTRPEVLPSYLHETGQWYNMPAYLVRRYEAGQAAVQAAAEQIEEWLDSLDAGDPRVKDSDMATKLVQAELHSGDTVRTCWLEAGVKPGDQVTLKNSEDPKQWWDVVSVGSEQRTANEINRGWNNNI